MTVTDQALATPTSHGYGFGSAPVGELRDSNSLLNQPDLLRQRMTDDGYLLLRRALDPDQVLAARAELCRRLAGVGLIDQTHPVTAAIYSGSNAGLGAIDRQAFARDLRRGPALRALL